MDVRSPWSRKRTTLFLCGGVLVLAVLTACAFFRIWLPRDVVAYSAMARECHPVWRQFAFRRYGAGDSASDLLQRFPPSAREEFGRYAVYRYYQGGANRPSYTGFLVVARDGKLLRAEAGGCTWQFRFFQSEDANFDGQYAAFVERKQAQTDLHGWGLTPN